MTKEDGVQTEHGMIVYESWKGGYYRKKEVDYLLALHKYKRCIAEAKNVKKKD